jgi:hypothetical protein
MLEREGSADVARLYSDEQTNIRLQLPGKEDATSAVRTARRP